MALTIGHDAEVFLRDVKTKEFVPAFGLIGGSKQSPLKVPGGAIQEDNVTAELNIDPATTFNEFWNNTQRVMQSIKDKVEPMGLEVAILPDAEFTEDMLSIDPSLMKAGCDPDYNAYTMRRNPVPDLRGTLLRTCGGHIHIGEERCSNDPSFVQRYVKLLDITVGLLEVIYGKKSIRKSLYGSQGAFRFKPYGFEARSPSNFWLSDKDVARKVYNNTVVTFQLVQQGIDRHLMDVNENQQMFHDDNLEGAKKFLSSLNHLGIVS